MIKLLHFADAHIDLARQGRHDPESGLPLRVLDFLKALDTIIDTAVDEKVDLVIFAGDAYRDRTPAPTYQREWGKRIMRLSEAGIQTLMVVGNHDVSPASGRAHTMQEYETLQVPNVRVISKPCLLRPDDLNGLPVQVIGIPWLNRSGLAAALIDAEEKPDNLKDEMESSLSALIEDFIDHLDPDLPAILTSHVTVQGATYGAERSVMLGRDFMLPGSLVRNPHLDYVALGHIHKFQNLNPEGHPPVIYPGSIERVDFGEVSDEKAFVLAELERGHTALDIRKLKGRKFIDKSVSVTERENVQETILKAMPSEKEIQDAIFRLVIRYPRDWEALIDEPAIRRKAEGAFEFHLIRRPQIQARLRLPEDKSVASMSPQELLEIYWDATGKPAKNTDTLNQLAGDIIQTVEGGIDPQEVGQA
jgi:exonuclease SbcD